MKIKENQANKIIQVKLMTPFYIAVCSPDDFFIDENNNYVSRYRVDIYYNVKCQCGNLVDCETGFKTMNGATDSAIDYLERMKL